MSHAVKLVLWIIALIAALLLLWRAIESNVG